MGPTDTEIHSVLPLSPQILAAYVIPEQKFSLPIRSWISPWQPHTWSGLSRIPPGLLLHMHPHPAESLFKSVTLFRLILSSFHLCCKREKHLFLLHGGWAFCHPASGCWTRKVFMASSRWFQILFATSSLNFPTATHWLEHRSLLASCKFSSATSVPSLYQGYKSCDNAISPGLPQVWAQRSVPEPHLCWSRSFVLKLASHKEKFIALCCPRIALPACTDTISNQNIRLPSPLLLPPSKGKTSFW